MKVTVLSCDDREFDLAGAYCIYIKCDDTDKLYDAVDHLKKDELVSESDFLEEYSENKRTGATIHSLWMSYKDGEVDYGTKAEWLKELKKSLKKFNEGAK